MVSSGALRFALGCCSRENKAYLFLLGNHVGLGLIHQRSLETKQGQLGVTGFAILFSSPKELGKEWGGSRYQCDQLFLRWTVRIDEV